ncbi:MAG: PorV/PorQ family protein, partial [Bacteroides sp.]
MNKRIKIVSLALLLGVSSYTTAQSLNTLEIPTDPRATAMGGSAVALSANAFSIYQNSASIAFSEQRLAVGYSFTDWYGKNRMHTASGFYNFQNNHSLALGVRYFDGDKISNSQDGINSYQVNPYDFILDLGYAYKVGDFWSVSANVRYLHSKINSAPGIKRGNAFGLDFALNYRDDHFSAAAAVQGLGSRVDYGFKKNEMPAKALLGFAYTIDLAEDHVLTTTLEGDYRFMPTAYKSSSGGLGAEYVYKDLLALRGGYRLADKNKSAGSYG